MPILEKRGRFKINDFSFHLMNLEDEQIYSKVRRKELIKIRNQRKSRKNRDHTD